MCDTSDEEQQVNAFDVNNPLNYLENRASPNPESMCPLYIVKLSHMYVSVHMCVCVRLHTCLYVCVCMSLGMRLDVPVCFEEMGINRTILDSASVTFEIVSGVYGVLVAI